MHVLRSPTLPYVTLNWITENIIVAGGHDCQPVLFEGDVTSGWKISKSLDAVGSSAAAKAPPPPPPKAAGLSSGAGSGVGRLNNEAFNRFKSADARGSAAAPSALNSAPSSPGGAGGSSVAGHLGAVAGASVSADGELHTTHQNTITSIRTFEGSRDDVKSVSTSGVDGRLCVFDVKGRGSGIGGIQKGVASMRVA